MNTAIKKRMRGTKDTNVGDRLRLVGNMQDDLTVTEAAKKLDMDQPWGIRVAGPLQSLGF